MPKLIFLDTETTGLGPEDRIIQLYMHAPAESEAGQIFHSLFKPPISITYEAMSVHHITQEMVDKSPSFVQYKDEVQNLINDRIIVAHNASFDIEILRREGIKINQFIDTLKIAQFLFDEPMYKLQYLRYKFGLKVKGKAHDAEGDVAVLEALFKHLFMQFSISKIELELLGPSDVYEKVINKMAEISKKPILLRRIPFGKHKDLSFNQIPQDYIKWLSEQKDLSQDLKYTLDSYLKPKEEVKTDQQKLL